RATAGVLCIGDMFRYRFQFFWFDSNRRHYSSSIFRQIWAIPCLFHEEDRLQSHKLRISICCKSLSIHMLPSTLPANAEHTRHLRDKRNASHDESRPLFPLLALDRMKGNGS
ncbi:hypothetical protein, partial [Symbiobacterium thermophilum]|uniref:hypothetical protein n=1 Tax=Symbiobacterium thermophilum TaxID=2734 RepID=UPI002357E735